MMVIDSREWWDDVRFGDVCEAKVRIVRRVRGVAAEREEEPLVNANALRQGPRPSLEVGIRGGIIGDAVFVLCFCADDDGGVKWLWLWVVW